MNIHFIAIGGSAMHNLAIALHKKGYKVTGSDDEIFEPSKSRLAKHGLLPQTEGWKEENIRTDLDAVILGMHARNDNPELLKAKTLGLKIYSYPEYIYEQSKNKTRVVIGGSHGKTSITAMVLHVLQKTNIDADYMVGAQLEGFETMVKITDAPVIILEGDEYLSSPIDRRPKFHLYQPNIALLSGIAWDHINVFPTFENYVEQFKIFIDLIEDNGYLAYYENDKILKELAEKTTKNITKVAYSTPSYYIDNGTTYLKTVDGDIPLIIFGEHNLQNLNGAKLICNQLGVKDAAFYKAITSFKGAAKRLELIAKNNRVAVYKDFAHSPSKLKATTKAVKQQYPNRKVVACMELHTFSSLNKNFLSEYENAMSDADEAYVYYSEHTLEHKKLEHITPNEVKKAFVSDNVEVINDSKQLVSLLENKNWNNSVLLLMSSGNFDGVDLNAFGEKIVG
ncbi:MAG: Mur ligase family protein [Flavobacteriales bacterium]|nr:Mur ligase family protein [Flavobacteriales bacterium]MCW8912689.1 Mur ligase family protein [Flavobacteriales bacterium]MCW8938832.1 Mur ligase family protein [Flavobacteriales bacterium]MCW8941372.1 Mur ligase family protein [Flavobacteriales bacterium]MCW8968144.1 Mur ligase family protein [Flavobacteriales bacterium]